MAAPRLSNPKQPDPGVNLRAMRDLVIFGSGGYAREACQVIEDVNADSAEWRILGFLDDSPEKHGTELRGLPVLGGRDWLPSHPSTAVVVAIGASAGRSRVVGAIAPADFPTIVHPTAWIGNNVTLGPGSMVLAGTAISTDIRIGAHAVVNKNAIIGHDAQLADFVTVAPGASISGYAVLGEGCEVGANSVVVQHVSVGEWAIVGAGAVANRDLPANTTAVGVPAEVIKQREPGWQHASGAP